MNINHIIVVKMINIHVMRNVHNVLYIVNYNIIMEKMNIIQNNIVIKIKIYIYNQ